MGGQGSLVQIQSPRPTDSNLLKMLRIVLLLIFACIVSVALYHIWKYWTLIIGAGYDPTPTRIIKKMLAMAETGEDDIVYDLGCGDGRIVLTSAREFGANAVGIEADPLRFLVAYIRAFFLGMGRVRVRFGNFMKFPIDEATCVTIFLFTKGNEMLIPKFEKELSPGTKVVSYIWRLKGWKPIKIDPVDEIYMYLVPEK